MTTYYKAVRPDGTDFYTGTVRWLPEDGVIPEGGWLVEHPAVTEVGRDADTYLSVSTVVTACTGMEWPCRLLLVEAVDDVATPEPGRLPHKRAAVAWRVVAELPAHEALGPQGAEVAAIIDRAAHLTLSEVHDLTTAWHTAWYAANDAARYDVWYAASDAACDAVRATARNAVGSATRIAVWSAGYSARYVAQDAALAVLTRDLITAEQYNLLIGPWHSVMGEIDPQELTHSTPSVTLNLN